MSLPRDVEGVRVLAEKLAREHAAGGGKVVGYLTPCVPAEMIEAAGLRPIMLSAGTETSTALGDEFMEDLFDTALRGVFERLLKGEFDFLSAIVLPRANDSAHRLYYYLCELKRTGGAKLPPVLLCDVAMTPDEASRRYSVDALGRLWEELKAIGNGAAGEAELRAAIAMANSRVTLLDTVAFLRRTLPGSVSGAEVLAMFAGARMLSGEFDVACAERLEALTGAARAGATTKTDAPRVIVCGSAHDGAGLHGLIEAAGGVVVGDYHAGGEPSTGVMADFRAPPLEALADRHRADAAASRMFGDPGKRIVEFAATCEAKLAILSYFSEEEALTWDYPEQKAALEAAGVRVLRVQEQTRPFDVEANRAAVEAFVRGGGG